MAGSKQPAYAELFLHERPGAGESVALEGVLVPVTASWNAELLRSAGFTDVDVFWRWLNFAGFVAIK